MTIERIHPLDLATKLEDSKIAYVTVREDGDGNQTFEFEGEDDRVYIQDPNAPRRTETKEIE